MWGAVQGSSPPARLVGWAWGGRKAGSPRPVHAAFLFPSFAQDPASSSPLCGRPTPLLAPPGCHALSLGTGSLLGTASPSALLQVPAVPALCFPRSSPCNANPFLPCAHLELLGGAHQRAEGTLTPTLVGLAPGKPLPAYSRLFLPFCCSSLGERGGLTPRLSGLEPRALHLRLLPCPGVALCQPHPQPCTETHTHTCIPAHTHVHCPVAQETCRGPSPVGIKVQPSGHGASDSGSQEGALWTFGTTSQETLSQEGEERA